MHIIQFVPKISLSGTSKTFWKAFSWERVLNGIINLDSNFFISKPNSGWKDVVTFHRVLCIYGLERGYNVFKESIFQTGMEKCSNRDSSISSMKILEKDIIHTGGNRGLGGCLQLFIFSPKPAWLFPELI